MVADVFVILSQRKFIRQQFAFDESSGFSALMKDV